MHYVRDNYLQWIESSHLQDLREASSSSSLDYGCTHVAEWSRPSSSYSITVMLKKIVDEPNAQSFDFNKVRYSKEKAIIVSTTYESFT